MGEIGTDRREYLYELTYCDLILIERGYDRRHSHLWSTTRWETYHLMCAFVGGDKLAEKGIYKPQDLIKFPWDGEAAPPITDEERKELQDEMAAINAGLKKVQADNL